MWSGVKAWGQISSWLASAILTAVHFWALPLIPESAQNAGSLAVITSEYGYLGAIPLATMGAIYYIVMITLGGLWLSTKNETLERYLLPITGVGVVASAGFVYLQLGVIGAICPFCMVSAFATFMLFGIELIIKYNGGAYTVPAVAPSKVWPAVVVAVTVAAIIAMWSLSVLPLPIEGA